MMSQFASGSFPSRANHIRALWAPVLLCPRLGSPENLVIGIAAVNASDFYLAEANAWRRLVCLYDEDADTALLAARVALDSLRADLSARGEKALYDPQQTFSGISFGPPCEGEGTSLKQIASLWLQTLSSLYDAALTKHVEEFEQAGPPTRNEIIARSDRLPVLVFEYIEHHRPGLVDAFNAEIRKRRQRNSRPKAQNVYIGFAGSLLVANFATLPPNRSKSTIDHIKRLMWDLEQNRDEQPQIAHQRTYEMIVKHQEKSDPHITEKQYNGVLEVIDELAEQGHKHEIVVVAKSSVPAIGTHVLELERAA